MAKKRPETKKEKPGPEFDQACAYMMHLGEIALIVWLLRLKRSEMEFVRWLPTKNIAWPGHPNRTCDTVADLRSLDWPWLLVIEFQIEADSLMFGRLMIYLGNCWLQNKPNKLTGDRYQLGAVVVNLTGKGCASQTMALKDTDAAIKFQIVERNFQEESALKLVEQIEAGEAPALALVWLPLFAGGGDDTVIKRAVALANAQKDPKFRQAFELVLLFAEKAGCLDAWREALKEFSMARSKVADEWRAEARAEGLAAGKAEGRREEKVALLVRALESKAKKEVPQTLRASLEAIQDNTRLDELFDIALKARSLAAFSKEAKLEAASS